MRLDPGQGKTFIAILLAKNHADRGEKVCIVVHSNLAKVQYMQILNKYRFNGIDVLEARRLKADSKYTVYILDEADELLTNHAVYFDQIHKSFSYYICGLAAVTHGKRAYLMSATTDRYE